MFLRVRAGCAVILLALAGCSGGRPPTVPPVGADWTTYHYDAGRGGSPPGVPRPRRLATLWSARLDGAVYGQPLVIGKTVVAATEGDSVYGLDRATGRTLWRTRLGTPVPRRSLPCANVAPLGITSTPVYDPGTGRVFVVAEIVGFHHILVGLSAKDGRIQVTRDILVPDGNPQNDQQRAALLLSRGRVYVAFGGTSEGCGQYVGSIVGVPVSGLGNMVAWKVPTTRGGSIWATGGPAAGPDGTVYVAVGNGLVGSARFDGTDSITALTPDLKVKSQFGPAKWASGKAAGLDLGSTSPVLLSGKVLAVGRRGTAYLLLAQDLRGLGAEIAQAGVCSAYGGPSVQGDTVYVPCNDGTRAVGTIGDQIKVLWRGPGETIGSPVVGGAAVWTTSYDGLYALDQGTGKTLHHIEVGRLPPYASPTLSGALVLLGTLRGITAISAL